MIKQIENIIEILSKQETDLNIENRQQFKINLSEIYLNLFYYVLYWHFINHDLIIILEEIKNLKDRFVKENDDLKEESILDYLDNLEFFIKKIFSLKNSIKLKRENIIELEQDLFIKKELSIIEELLFFLIKLNYLQLKFEWYFFKIKNIFIKNYIDFFEEIQTKKSNKDNYEKYKKEINIIEDILILNIYKISLITKTNQFNYFINFEKKPLNIEKNIKDSIFSKYINELKLISEKKKWDFSFINDIYLTKELTSIDFFLLVKYYKEKIESKEDLKILYNKYKNIYYNKKDNNNYLNFIFIWNNYFSFLIKKFENKWNNKLIYEIEKIFKELNSVENNDNKYKNFFTDYKYLYFKNLQYKYLKENKSEDFNILNILEDAEKSWDNSYKIIEDLEYNCFYEFNFEDNKILVKWFEEKIFVFNMFSFPYDMKKYKYLLKNERRILNENKFEYKYTKDFSNIEEKIDNNKLDAIAVIWLFTWIVVYSLWTIQIFAIIEDLWSAIMFAWIFLSWILFLLWWIYYNNKINFCKNKWFHLFCIAFIVLITALIWKYYFSWKYLNVNKGKNTKEELEIQIKKAEIIKKDLEKLITD